jgi:hypothetical protein
LIDIIVSLARFGARARTNRERSRSEFRFQNPDQTAGSIAPFETSARNDGSSVMNGLRQGRSNRSWWFVTKLFRGQFHQLIGARGDAQTGQDIVQYDRFATRRIRRRWNEKD